MSGDTLREASLATLRALIEVDAPKDALWKKAALAALRVLEAHRCALPASIQEALNSGDGTYRP